MFCCCAQDTKGEKLADIQLNSAFSPAESPVVLLEETVAQEPIKIDPPQPEPPPSKAELTVEDPPMEVAKVEEAPAPEIEVPKVEEAPKVDEPEVPPHRDFKVNIKKDHKDAPIGLELDTVGASCGMVMQVMEGAVKAYNTKAPADDRVRPGDFIIAVNGVKGDTKGMAQQAVQDLKLELLFRRPSEFVVVLDKEAPGAAKSCGMDLEYLGIGRTLLIQDIKDGLVSEWNRTHPNRQVKINDRIVSVNAFHGEAEKMLEMCTKSQKLELKIARA